MAVGFFSPSGSQGIVSKPCIYYVAVISVCVSNIAPAFKGLDPTA